MSISFTTAETQLYNGLNAYVSNSLIQLSEFWTSDRLCIPIQQFFQMANTIGYSIPSQHADALQNQDMDFITIENVLQGVQYWKTQEQSIGIYLSKSSPKKQKNMQKQDLHQQQQQTSMIDVSRAMKTNSKYLKQHSKKQLKQKMKLQKTLREVKNQSEYEITVKVGQANDICRKLKNGTSFILDTKGGALQIIESGKNGTMTINVKNFQRRYQNLKKAAINMAPDEEDEQGSMEEDLKKVLVEVMCLSTEMKKQIKIFQQKGISHE